MPDYNCDAVSNAFIKETGRINDDDLFRRNVRKRPIVDLTMEHRGAWMDGMGVIISNLTMARNFPLDPVESRINVATSGGVVGTDACTPPIITLKDGQIRQDFQLRHLAMQTPDYCVTDIRSSTQFSRVLGQKKRQLAEITGWTWANWFTYDYVGLSGHKLTQQTTGAYDNGSAGNVNVNLDAPQAVGYSTTNLPTAGLSMGLLEDISTQVFNEGEFPFATDSDTGGPANILILGEAQSRKLLRDNASLRDDIRYAFMGSREGSPLLPSGRPRKVRNFGGFVHMIDPYPRRFDFEGGAYVQRQPLSEVDVSIGTNQNLSAAYRFARYEEVILWHPGVYRSLAPNTMPVNVPGWCFDPVNHMGEFQCLNIKDKKCNPLGEKVFWHARFGDAAEPLYPNVGYSILVLNCGFERGGPACTPASSSSGSGI